MTRKSLNRVKLCHLRLGYIRQKGLDELKKQGLLGKDSLEKLSFCEDCVFGKSRKESFKTATQKTKQTLDYIQPNLWGLSKIHSHGGATYFMSIIDDYSINVYKE